MKQEARKRKLVGKACKVAQTKCANSDKEGGCLLSHDVASDENAACNAIACGYFHSAVLPASAELMAEVEAVKHETDARLKDCNDCGRRFIKRSNRQQYCADCSKNRRRDKERQRQRKRRRHSD